jgi:hypothetical protein
MINRYMGWYRNYGARPEPLNDEQRHHLADALEELARLVREGTVTGGKAKAWPYSSPDKFAAAKVTEGAHKCVVVGVELAELPPSCAQAAALFSE